MDQGTQQRATTRPIGLAAVVAAALLGQFFAAVAGLGTFGIAQPGHHLSETPGRDIMGGFVWVAVPGLVMLAGAAALSRARHNLAATIVLSAMWLASLFACFLVWSDMGDVCASSDGGPTCPGRSFVAVGVISAVVGITLLGGALRCLDRSRRATHVD